MKHLKLFAILGIFSAMIYSCDTIPCDDVDCGDNGTCNETDGSCICDQGYAWSDSAGTCLAACLVLPCPDNSTCNETTLLCECDSGFIMLPNGICIDLCILVNCGLNGTCDFNTGECICDPGYGPGNLSPCEAFNLKFVGQWLGSHTDELGNTTGPYTINAIADSDPAKVRFDNFMMYGCTGQPALSVLGTVGPNGLNITAYNSLCADWQTNGTMDTGTLSNSGNTLNITVTISSGGTGSTLTGTYVRQ